MPPSPDAPLADAPAAKASAATRPAAPEAPLPTRLPSLEDVQQRVGTLERRLANLESAYTELLAMLVAHGDNHLAALEQNLRNLLPAPSNRGHQETRDDGDGPAAAEPPATRRRLQG